MNIDKTVNTFNLPYNQSQSYWLTIFTPADNEPLRTALKKHGLKASSSQPYVYNVHLDHPWDKAWITISSELKKHDAGAHAEAALVPGDAEPEMEERNLARKPAAMLDALAESLWLGDAMIEDRIVCYMQPVLDKRGKIFGYEAFARVETEKSVIGGGKILEASKALNVEYMLDRHLHVKAITSFISSDLEGFLFINFVPGFIHRPEKYLEGLSEAAKFHGMPAKQLVLDFTHSELPRDPMHVKAVFDYCRSKGYSMSLDDIASVGMAKKILDSIRPDFIKLDITLVRDAQGQTNKSIINEIITLARASGATLVAEGVETPEVHQELLRLGIDLFQGYLFSPPVAISALKKAVG